MPRKKKQIITDAIVEKPAEEIKMDMPSVEGVLSPHPLQPAAAPRVLEEAEEELELPTVAEIKDIAEKKAGAQKPERSKKIYNLSLAGAVVLIVILMAGVGVYKYKQPKQVSLKEEAKSTEEISPAEEARQEVVSLVNKVSQIIQLPQNEEPSIATVVDLAPLKGQVFFENAEVGDKALVYVSTGKAYLYRPSVNKIIEVGSFSSPQNQVLGSATQSVKTTVEIRNGSGVAGAGAKAKAFAVSKGLNVTLVGNAQKSNYTQSQVVVLKPSVDQGAVTFIAQIFKAQVTNELPAGEEAFKADVLVIVGKN